MLRKKICPKRKIISDLLAAVALDKGVDESVDYLRAAAHFKRAARDGSRYAAEKLADLSKKGLFDEVDLKQALRELEQSHLEEAVPARVRTLSKVLVVEDGEEARTLYSYMLNKSGYEPILATDGLDALEKTLLHPDLKCMLIDLQMPQMNGFEFIQALRSQHAFGNIPIVVITAFTNPELVKRGRNLKVDGWLQKPVRKDLLVGTVERVLRKAAG